MAQEDGTEDMGGLFRQFVTSLDFQAKLQSVVKQANDEGLHGAELQRSLVISGAMVGTEHAERYFFSNSNDMVILLRSTLARLDTLILSTSDCDTLAVLQETRKHFSDVLSSYAKSIHDTFVTAMEEAIGLPRKYMTEKTSVEDYPTLDLQAVGFTVYQSAPSYFHAWHHFKNAGGLPKMRCRCYRCLVENMRKEFDSWKSMQDAVRDGGGLNLLFSNFGSFIISESRENLLKILQGEEHEGAKPVMDPETEAANALLQMRTPPREE